MTVSFSLCLIITFQNSWLNYLLLNGDFGIDFANFDNVLGAAFPIVPNIIHFIKIGNKSDLTFEELVCIKAAWLAQKPERILIHCDYCDYLKARLVFLFFNGVTTNIFNSQPVQL